jgi:hypothetical protein
MQEIEGEGLQSVGIPLIMSMGRIVPVARTELPSGRVCVANNVGDGRSEVLGAIMPPSPAWYFSTKALYPFLLIASA